MITGVSYLLFFFLPFFFPFVCFSAVSSSTFFFLTCVVSSTADMACLRADEATGGDSWRKPLHVNPIVARVVGIG
jgi:hypothetical protein